MAQGQDLHPMLRLKRVAGNQAVLRLLPGGVLQAKLAMATPGDEYEQEAERVAGEVTRTAPAPMVQRHCACGGIPGPDGECAACRAKPLARQERPASPTGPAVAPPIVGEVLRSPGQPLDAAARASFEPRFGHDFSRVRVHTDALAAHSAEAVAAQAYTVGNDIVFGAGRFTPETQQGWWLIAHELTHVVQQRCSGVDRIQRQPKGSRRLPPGPGEYTEEEYDAWAKAHPKREYRVVVYHQPGYARYTPQWFWDHGYVYAGRGGGQYSWARFEVWISDRDGGKELRVWTGGSPVASAEKEPPQKKPPEKREPPIEPPIKPPPMTEKQKKALELLERMQSANNRLTDWLTLEPNKPIPWQEVHKKACDFQDADEKLRRLSTIRPGSLIDLNLDFSSMEDVYPGFADEFWGLENEFGNLKDQIQKLNPDLQLNVCMQIEDLELTKLLESR